jgi:hypothetical protein
MSELGTLVTVANKREALKVGTLAREVGIPLVVDSGAWSNFTGAAKITVTDHINWLSENWQTGARHIGLDVIGNPDGTFTNWKKEREAGLAVEPTIHFGTDPRTVDKYLAEGLATEWVNLGGMAHLQKYPGKIRQLAAWCAAVIVRCPEGTKFHALGATTPALNNLVTFDAVDATYWLQVHTWKRLGLFNPDTTEYVGITRQTQSKHFMAGQYQRIGKHSNFLKKHYGVSGQDVLNASEELMIDLAIKSMWLWGEHYGKRSGKNILVYLAGSGPTHFPYLKKYNLKGNT